MESFRIDGNSARDYTIQIDEVSELTPDVVQTLLEIDLQTFAATAGAFCLGAALARMEVNSFFSELVPRLQSIELAGEPEYTATIFVGGPKHLPIRYSLR